MRKISMKKRGRSSLKVENNGNASMEESDEVVNGSEKGSPDKKKRGRNSKVQEEENAKNDHTEVSEGEQSDAEEESEQEEPDKKKKRNSKKVSFGKKNSKNNTSSEEEENDEENEEEDDDKVFEVEAIFDEKKIKNTRHYLVRWKGYSSEHDTWEPESTLNCTELLQKYKESKKNKPKKAEVVDENADYEVERIVEVHFKRDGKREFLVSWKGYSQSENTWEPEENMDCADLIAKFMSKVEQAKNIDQRLLRPYRAHTERFTLTTNDSGRRVSKRNSNKQRVRYMDCE